MPLMQAIDHTCLPLELAMPSGQRPARLALDLRVLPSVQEVLAHLHSRGVCQSLLTGNLESIARLKLACARPRSVRGPRAGRLRIRPPRSGLPGADRLVAELKAVLEQANRKWDERSLKTMDHSNYIVQQYVPYLQLFSIIQMLLVY